VEIEMAGLRRTRHHKAILFLTIVAITTQSIKADSPPLKLVAAFSQRGLRGEVTLSQHGQAVKVVADLAVAEGREGEYKAGIYQFPIDYTKVPLFQISLFTLFLCRRTTATQSTRVDDHCWTWRNRRGCCSFPAPTRSSWKSRR